MKIGYLLRMYPRFTQTFVANEIMELESQGADIGIFSLRLPNEGIFHESCSRVRARASYAAQGESVRLTGLLKSHWRLWRKYKDKYRANGRLCFQHKGVSWSQIDQAAQLIRWYRKNKLAHVHVHFGTDEATVALLANGLADLPYTMTLHAFDIFRHGVDRELLTKKINASRFTITVSEYNRRYLLKTLPGVNPEKIRVNYNGIDLARFRATEVDRQPMSVFAVGRLIEKKGFIHLVRAVGRLREAGMDVICRIAGEGREEPVLRREIKRLKLDKQVELLGRVRQTEVAEYLKRAACFVLPCVEARDGNVDALPTVLLESLASGCPTVSTSVSGVPEIIDSEQHGLLVPPENDAALAEAIQRILADAKVAESFAERGRCRAEERFDISKNVAIMHDWLRQSIGGGHRSVDSRKIALDSVKLDVEAPPCHAGS
ncbi:MAG: glycosyltransferase family 4 protein [Planctomycetota bacterium]|jgi:glycosyltransferase involved in cell wall biosynthesis